MKALSPLFLLFLWLAAITPAPAQETLEPEPWKKRALALSEKGYKETRSKDKIQVPYLSAPALERSLGQPTLSVAKDGSYILRYTRPDNSFESFVIYGLRQPFPRLASVPPLVSTEMIDDQWVPILKPQEWKLATLLSHVDGQPVRTVIRHFRYDDGGGADAPMDGSDVFTITAGGRTGYYLIRSLSLSEAIDLRLALLQVE